MPKVTLLAEPWQNYCVPFGKREFLFVGGKPTAVPPAVAIFCKKKRNEAGEPVFSVEGLDEVIVKPEPSSPKQNVEKVEGSRQFSQLRLIEAELCQ
jgi:hypothetical protein